MSVKLFFSAIIKFLLGVALVGALIFLPAGTILYFNGLLLMGILFVPMFFAGVVMMVKNPSLLKSRLDAKEKEKDQSLVVKLSGRKIKKRRGRIAGDEKFKEFFRGKK